MMDADPVTTVGSPVLSVILLSQGDYTGIRRTVRHFMRQTIRDRIELVLVTLPGPKQAPDPGDMAAFHSHSVVEIQSMPSTAVARAAGVRVARADYVAFGEEHSHPAPDWSEFLVRTLDEGYAAVGPTIRNANPWSALSWANLLPEYGQWMARPRDDEADHLPGHNGSYRRDVLLAYGDRLGELLIAESVLQWDLRARGYKLCLQTAATTYHLNVSRWRPTFGLRVRAGRVFAAERARGWPVTRRVAYTLGSPLIPFIRFRRTIGDARRIRAAESLPAGTLAATFVTLILDSIGEMIGYATGAGSALDVLTEFEFNRFDYLSSKDRELLTAKSSA